MAESAHVNSIDAVKRLLERLLHARLEIMQVLAQTDQHAARVQSWFEHDAGAMWRERGRRCSEELSEARIRLERCRMSGVGGHVNSCYEERKAVERAKQRLQTAEQQVQNVARWATRLNGEAEEHRGRSNGLRLYMEGDFQRSIAMLEHTIRILESYLEDSATPSSE